MMHKATIYKLLRCLVCLLLVCCILINCSPIKAKATVIAATAVTGTAAAGVLGWLFAAAMGVVFVDLTADLLSGIGTSVKQHVSTYYEDDTETTTTVNDFWSDLSYTFGGSGDDGTNGGNGSDDSDSGLTHIPTLMLAGLIDWVKGLINGDTSVEVEEEVEAAEGLWYYNGVLLPDYSPKDGFSYVCITYDDTLGYRLWMSDYPFIRYSERYTYNYWSVAQTTTYYLYYINDSFTGWKGNKYTLNPDYMPNGFGDPIWSNYNIYDHGFNSGVDTLLMTASEPSLVGTQTTTVEPSTYVGDIPQQVQDGTFEEEKYELPYINYSQIFQGRTDVIEALNNVSAQLADQTMTYQQYMEQIQVETSTDTSGGSSDIETPSPVPELAPYAYDLKKYFPFCIPFDLYDFFSILVAEPEAPQFHWEIQDLSGNVYEIDIDLSPWDDLASFFRILQLFLFITGLAASSRKFIKW